MPAPGPAQAVTDHSVALSALDQLTPDQASLFLTFDRLRIKTTTYDHMPVFTVAESEFLKDSIPGTHGKSLLLTNKSGRIWMVSAADETTIDLKYLSDTLQTQRFSFAKPEVMAELLHVTPGSLTPFSALFDTAGKVEVILDNLLMQQETCVFHPLINTGSTVMATADLARFLNETGHPPQIMHLSPQPAA